VCREKHCLTAGTPSPARGAAHPQSCAFRDHAAELADLGASLFGISTQATDYQREMVERLHLSFEVLSDAELSLATALRLPTFEVDGMRLINRLTLIVKDNAIEHVFYPVFPPDENAGQVIRRLRDDTPKATGE